MTAPSLRTTNLENENPISYEALPNGALSNRPRSKLSITEQTSQSVFALPPNAVLKSPISIDDTQEANIDRSFRKLSAHIFEIIDRNI